MSESDPPEKPRGPRRARFAAVGLLVAAAVGASVLAAVTTPTGLGEPTVAVDLTDADRSLAVAVLPRVPELGGLLELPEPSTAAPALRGRWLGDSGAALVDAWDVDRTVAAVRAVAAAHPAAGPAAVRAESVLGRLVTELADLPPDAPADLRTLSVGPELTAALDALHEYTADDAAVTVTFTADPVAVAAPESSAPAGTGAFLGARSLRLTEPGLYVFRGRTAPDGREAVLVDDPLTVGLDLGRRLWVDGRETPVSSDHEAVTSLVADVLPALTAPVLQYDASGAPFLVPDLSARTRPPVEGGGPIGPDQADEADEIETAGSDPAPRRLGPLLALGQVFGGPAGGAPTASSPADATGSDAVVGEPADEDSPAAGSVGALAAGGTGGDGTPGSGPATPGSGPATAGSGSATAGSGPATAGSGPAAAGSAGSAGSAGEGSGGADRLRSVGGDEAAPDTAARASTPGSPAVERTAGDPVLAQRAADPTIDQPGPAPTDTTARSASTTPTPPSGPVGYLASLLHGVLGALQSLAP